MPETKKISENSVPFIFLKWLVIVLSVILISGFLFLVTTLSVKIYNFNTTPLTQNKNSNQSYTVFPKFYFHSSINLKLVW